MWYYIIRTGERKEAGLDDDKKRSDKTVNIALITSVISLITTLLDFIHSLLK